MNNISIVAKAVGLALVVGVSAPALAAETATVSASVTVKNTFELTVTKPLSFGEITAIADTDAGGEQASLTISSNPTVQPSVDNGAAAKAEIRSLLPGEAAEIAVAGVAPFSELTITLPEADDVIHLVAAAAPPNSPEFILSDFDAYITSGTNSGSVYLGAAGETQKLLTADASGAASFNVGATLSTEAMPAAAARFAQQYQDGEYTGSFSVVVEY